MLRTTWLHTEDVPNNSFNNIYDIINLDTGKGLVIADELSKLEDKELIDTLEEWAMVLSTRSAGSKTNYAYDSYSILQNILQIKEDIENTNVTRTVWSGKAVLRSRAGRCAHPGGGGMH